MAELPEVANLTTTNEVLLPSKNSNISPNQDLPGDKNEKKQDEEGKSLFPPKLLLREGTFEEGSFNFPPLLSKPL